MIAIQFNDSRRCDLTEQTQSIDGFNLFVKFCEIKLSAGFLISFFLFLREVEENDQGFSHWKSNTIFNLVNKSEIP